MMPFPIHERKLLGFVLVLGFLGVYAVRCLDGLAEQGLYHDVALFGVNALAIDSMGEGDGSPLHWRVGRWTFPLMVNDYNGPLEIYLAALPAIWGGGNTAVALNAASIFWGFIMLLAGALLSACYYRSVWAAAGFLALLAVSPSFIAGSRLGIYAGTVHGALFAMALLFFSVWMWSEARGKVLLAGFFFLGLSWGCRSLMIWYVAALAVVVLLSPQLRRKLMLVGPDMRWTAIGFLILGLLPVLIANIRGNWFTARFFAKFCLYSRSGISNLDYFVNVRERIREFVSMWDATAWLHPYPKNPWAIFLLAGSIFFVAWMRFVCQTKDKTATGFIPLVVIIVVLMLSPVTPTFLDAHHLFPLYPVAALLMLAPFFATVPNRWTRWARIVYAIFFGVYVLHNAISLHRAPPHHHPHGGYEVRWNVLQGVLDWVRQNNVVSLGIGDTGIMDPLNYLSRFEVDVEEVFPAPYLGPEENKSRENRLRRLFRSGETSHFLFRSERASRVAFLRDFLKIAKEEGMSATELATFKTPTGDPLFVIYHIKMSSERWRAT